MVCVAMVWLNSPLSVFSSGASAWMVTDSEALPTSTIRQRPPLAYQDVDIKTLAGVLERLCTDGLVVRWYEDADAPGRERQAVYRRVSSDST